jgi:pimeloyl-ACP methyl ester carboxylesterase
MPTMAFRLFLRLACLLLIALVSTTALARPTSQSMPRGLPQEPEDDPFYQPPKGFENDPPGTILRTRSVETAFIGYIPDPVESHQILYRTTAVDGSAIATVTTVFKPWFPKDDRFVSFHVAYDASATKCSPSYVYQWGAPPNSLISSYELLIIQVYLALGYVVAVPDYEGPHAAFSPGHIEGMGVLDNMRAVSNFGDSGLSTTHPMIIGYGYSGGAIATGWAGALQPNYAPELDIKGWVQGSTPSNLTGTMVALDGELFAGFVPPAVAGLLKPSAYEDELTPIMSRVMTDKGRKALDFTNSHCDVANLLHFAGASMLSTDMQTMGKDLLYDPTVVSVMKENILGLDQEETPTAPVYVYHASNDEIIPYSNASTMVDSWCNRGVDVKFTTFGNGGHLTTEIIGVVDAVKFAEAAFDGKTESGCSSNTVLNSDLNPLALGVRLEPILTSLVGALIQLGHQDENVKNSLETLKTIVT